MNKIYNINFIFIFARRIWKDFFNVFFRSFKKDIFNIFLEKTLLNKQGCKGKTSFSFFFFLFFLIEKWSLKSTLILRKIFLKRFMGFYFWKERSFGAPRKIPWFLYKDEFQKTLLVQKNFFFHWNFFSQCGKNIFLKAFLLFENNFFEYGKENQTYFESIFLTW